VTYYLFETVRLGIIIGFIAETLLFLAWTFARGRLPCHLLLTGPAIVALFILLDCAVQTDREQIQTITRQIIEAAEDENPGAIVAHLSDNLLINNTLTKDDVAGIIEYHLARPVISNNTVNQLLVTNVQDRLGQVEFKVTTNIDQRSPYAIWRIVQSRWRFDFVRDEPDAPYRVANMVMLSLQGQAPIDVFRKGPLDAQFR